MNTPAKPAPPVESPTPEELLALLQRLTHVSRLATMGEMAAGIAHELNQPLTAIASYAQACDWLLARGSTDTAEIRDALQQITAQGLRAGEIIRRLRNLVRTPDTARVETDVNELIEELKGLALTDARAHNVRLTLELAPALPRIVVNRVEIQQVVLNLVRNAVEALESVPPERRDVVLRSEPGPDSNVEVAVIDSGPGVDPAIVDRLFSPFVTTKATGAGLGLAISRSIVEAHKGTLRYRPAGAGGACFVLRLPHAQGGA
ncbi:MAG TPA: ATP-binding protein [Steroidobacteraceae bacterium]|jgi:two-component system sensor kinase FixL|nr:ATP-binding protein [Steroidobacteraceae bacterium]